MNIHNKHTVSPSFCLSFTLFPSPPSPTPCNSQSGAQSSATSTHREHHLEFAPTVVDHVTGKHRKADFPCRGVLANLMLAEGPLGWECTCLFYLTPGCKAASVLTFLTWVVSEPPPRSWELPSTQLPSAVEAVKLAETAGGQ